MNLFSNSTALPVVAGQSQFPWEIAAVDKLKNDAELRERIKVMSEADYGALNQAIQRGRERLGIQYLGISSIMVAGLVMDYSLQTGIFGTVGVLAFSHDTYQLNERLKKVAVELENQWSQDGLIIRRDDGSHCLLSFNINERGAFCSLLSLDQDLSNSLSQKQVSPLPQPIQELFVRPIDSVLTTVIIHLSDFGEFLQANLRLV